MINETPEVTFVVVEVWRGTASSAHAFRNRADADECAQRLRDSANLLEDDVAVIETRLR